MLIMADEAKVQARQCTKCRVKLSSDPAEPHSMCSDCRFQFNGHICTYSSRCLDCHPLDDASWKRFADLKKRLWNKSVASIKEKLPVLLVRNTRLHPKLVSSIFRTLPPTLSLRQFLDDVIK